MNCLCDIFDNCNLWVWIIILLVLVQLCNSCGGSTYSNGDRCCH